MKVALFTTLSFFISCTISFSQFDDFGDFTGDEDRFSEEEESATDSSSPKEMFLEALSTAALKAVYRLDSSKAYLGGGGIIRKSKEVFSEKMFYSPSDRMLSRIVSASSLLEELPSEMHVGLFTKTLENIGKPIEHMCGFMPGVLYDFSEQGFGEDKELYVICCFKCGDIQFMFIDGFGAEALSVTFPMEEFAAPLLSLTLKHFPEDEELLKAFQKIKDGQAPAGALKR